MSQIQRADRRCYTCRHWKPFGTEVEGNCHGVAPSVAWADGINTAVTLWPRTVRDEHCPLWAEERRPENRKGPLGDG